MRKIYLFIVTFVSIFVLLSGCTNQTNNNSWLDDNQNSNLDLSSVVQLSNFNDDLDHKYSSISGNGQKIIYVQYPRDEDQYQIGDTDHIHNACTLWVTDTSGSKNQEEIFSGYQNFYGFNGDNGGTPVLNYDATYAYFGVRKYINYIGYYWLPAHNPDYLARVRLSDKSFHPIDLSSYYDYDFTWLQHFCLGSNNIYAMVSFSDKKDAGTEVVGRGIIKMNLDGSNQQFIYLTNESNAEETSPHMGRSFILDESTNRLYYENRFGDTYYYLNLNTNNPVKINNEELGGFYLHGIINGKLIFVDGYDFFSYDINTDSLVEIEYEENGNIMYSISSDYIFFNYGSGDFGYTDIQGNTVKLIDYFEGKNVEYSGKYTWDGQFMPCNGKMVSSDGKKLLVKEDWRDTDNPNYYVLLLTGSSNSNLNNNNENKDNDDDLLPASNTITLIHAIQMFDFSTGQYISEDFTTEDIDVITYTTEEKIRLYAHNDAMIKEQGNSEYLSYIDVAKGAVCLLIDNEGGTATFTVDDCGLSSQGYPFAIITWSYS